MRLISFLLVLLPMAPAVGGADLTPTTTPPTAPVVTIEGERMSVQAAGVPVDVMLDAIARQLGAEIQGAPTTTEPITASFEDLPTQDALTRIFGENFSLVYSRTGSVKLIRFVGAAPTRTTTTLPNKPAAKKPEPPLDSLALRRLHGFLIHHPPVPISGVIAEAFDGAPAMRLDRIFKEVALGHPDASVRAEAIRFLAATVEGTPNLHAAASNGLKGIPQERYGELARRILGDHAPEFLGLLAPALQDRAIRMNVVRARTQLIAPPRVAPGP